MANFYLAPPPKTVDGLAAVPIDIQTINATFVFDGAASAATADATITYTVGPTAGNPIFDLRQTITSAWLDGASFPPAQLAHHNFGSGPFTNLRVIQSVQPAGSIHTLRVQYPLAMPNSEIVGGYLPAIEWSAGPRLSFRFGLSDISRARYAEAWLPANLIFDQFAITLQIQLTNTLAPHSIITNGLITVLDVNHWRLEFPSHFTAVSPLLEVRASDTLALQTDTTVLPVSGRTITLEAWKLVTSTVNLSAQLNTLKTLLSDNENAYGPYFHGNRFVAFFNLFGMEYDGGTTTEVSELAHETFHSWYARGIKPASHADSWWDEAFTTFYDNGADDALPFDYTAVPIQLCSRDPWQRHTPRNSYLDGYRFWQGIASQVGVAQLNAMMKDLYVAEKGNPVSTTMVEEFLLCRSGNAQIVDAFHRFIYGFDNPALPPDLWLRDDPADVGADQWNGTFWNSPDLWIRNADDGGTTHQPPEYGQDNWFYARVRNKADAGAARHFVVTFNSRGFAGTQFQYPGDFLPCIAARAEFELGPGETRIVKARWPRAHVPAEGTHTCLLAAVISRSDHPVAGRHVWEHNNLAQKNLTVVDLLPNTFLLLPVVVSNWSAHFGREFELEVVRVQESAPFEASLIHPTPEIFRGARAKARPFTPFAGRPALVPERVPLECGGYLSGARHAQHRRILTSASEDLIQTRYPESKELAFPTKAPARLAFELPPFNQIVVGLKIAVPGEAKAGEVIRLQFVQRSRKAKHIVGGVAVQINVTKPG